MQSKKVKLFKIMMLAVFILIMIFLTIKFLPLFKSISTEQGRIDLQNEIESIGSEGVIIIIGLMVVQIFLPILPGEPVEILAGMSYGAIGGLIIVFLGAFVSSFIIFFAVRKFGKNFIYAFVPKEKIEKIEKSKILSNQKRLDMILFVLFLIPGTPKDLFVYLGGLLPIKPMKFLLISTFARFPSIVSSTIAGSNLIAGNWIVVVITYIITFLIAALIIYFFNKNEKVYIKL